VHVARVLHPTSANIGQMWGTRRLNVL
jgi:hypothetical protein